MSQAKKGDTIKVHYTGRLADGSIFDSSQDREPLEVTLGAGSVIAGFDKGLTGMALGETKTINIPADDAYGEIRQDMIAEVDRKDIPSEIKPEVGQELELTQADNNIINVTISKIEDDKITIDANHPLAGKELIFDLEMIEIVEG